MWGIVIQSLWAGAEVLHAANCGEAAIAGWAPVSTAGWG